MNRLLGIDNIMYFVRDIERSVKFYEETLGMKRVWTDEKMGMIGFKFPKSDAEIVIHTDDTLPNPDFSFLVENVESFCQNFVDDGYQVKFGPIEVRCGKYAILSDLDDNSIPIIDLTKFGGVPQYDERE